ncbi:MAG: glycoside hydrolase family 15 protein [Candidatus Korarchaeota archaeon]
MVLANGKTHALVAPDTSINWLVVPYPDMTPLFARLLHSEGGTMKFDVAPISYDYESNSLAAVGRFSSNGKFLRIRDFMPWGKDMLVREISCEQGIDNLALIIEIYPGLEFNVDGNLLNIRPAPWDEWGYSRIPINILFDGMTIKKMKSTKQKIEIILSLPLKGKVVISWDEKKKSEGPHFAPFSLSPNYPPEVLRSILTLHALRSGPGIVAAATTSIPYHHGNVWDYRYVWIRDGTYTMETFLELGEYSVTREFLELLFEICSKSGKPWRPMYTTRGEPVPYETEITSLDGYMNCGLIRVGNRATSQLQLDSEGQVLSLLWEYLTKTNDIAFARKVWEKIERVADYVSTHWYLPDSGPWENPFVTHYVYSKIECWTALDRAIKIAHMLEAPIKESWTREWKMIKRWFLEHAISRLGYIKLATDLNVPDVLCLAAGFRGMFSPSSPFLVKTFNTILALGKNYLYPRSPLDKLPFLLATGWVGRYALMLGKNDIAVRIYHALVKECTRHGLLPENGSVELFNRLRIIKATFFAPLRTMNAVIKSLLLPPTRKPIRDINTRGNIPQAYSHLELVRLWLELKRANIL